MIREEPRDYVRDNYFSVVKTPKCNMKQTQQIPCICILYYILIEYTFVDFFPLARHLLSCIGLEGGHQISRWPFVKV